MRLRKRLFHGAVTLKRRLLGIPQPGQVNWGDLRRTTPISRHFGEDRPAAGQLRGQAIDRHYVNAFLSRHCEDIAGEVIEIGEPLYTRLFGADRVTRSEVLHVHEVNPQATIIADLADAPQLADCAYDCAIVTQTLHLIYEAPSAVRTLARILRPGGSLLLTVPGITPVPNGTEWAGTWHWAFTQYSVRRMLTEAFGHAPEVESMGNVMAATAFLHGLSIGELESADLDSHDPDFPLIIAARIVKQA